MTFSKRYRFVTGEPPITVRNDAPDWLRYAVIQNAYECGPTYNQIRSVVCRILHKAPDPYNWSEIPNIQEEVSLEILDCDWYKVYDIAEALQSFIKGTYGYGKATTFADSMNVIFVDAGIGWQFAPNEEIIFRGEETFQVATENAASILNESGRKNAASEIDEAIKDISRRPEPDVTGAISHAMAAVECVSQDIIGTKDTLGQMVDRLALPKPLDLALIKLWSFASQNGRHVSENSRPSPDDAELLVHVSCAICNYLTKKHS